jgi:small neutral amino acid transporter SnatA (MarC family)
MPLIAGPGAISTVMVLVGRRVTEVTGAASRSRSRRTSCSRLLILLAAPALVRRIGATGSGSSRRSWG